MSPEWQDLIAGVVGAVLGWFAKHWTTRKK